MFAEISAIGDGINPSILEKLNEEYAEEYDGADVEVFMGEEMSNHLAYTKAVNDAKAAGYDKTVLIKSLYKLGVHYIYVLGIKG
mgnify:CR=1 FL=1